MPLLGRDVSISGALPEGMLLLETLAGTEMLGAPYVYELGLLSEDHNIDPKTVLGEPMAVGIKLGTGDWRYFHGMVTSFAKSGNTRLHTRYAARLCPKLSLCDHTLDCRVFKMGGERVGAPTLPLPNPPATLRSQQSWLAPHAFNESPQDAVRIVTQVLADRDVTAVESGSTHDHAFRKRELCVQYQESDLHFVQRLLEEEGIYYFFRHQQDGHTLVLADSIGAHETSPGYEHVLYRPKAQEAASAEEHFWGMTVRKGMHPGQHTLVAGYDPTKKRPWQPRFLRELSGEPAPGRQFEHYDYPGGLCEPDEAGDEAKVRVQADRVEKNVIEVEGNTLGLGVGHLVTLLPDLDGGGEVFPFWKPAGFAKQYLIVGANYSITIDQYETGTAAGSDMPFKASYVLLDSQTPFRPRRALRKPRIFGPQTALVVGLPGEEIWTDKLGRLRVQFDWDRLGKHYEKSTCWVRSAEIWAGPGWGGQHLPRIGQEVVVRFLDGDPDRPIATGALYNADSTPPYELPKHATQSGIKSRSSKGGSASNFNEIRFEDKKGAEELHMQAERDMSTLVKHCQTLHVARNRSIVVGKNEDNLVKGNRTLMVRPDDKADGSPPVVVRDSVAIGGKHDKTVMGTVLQVYVGDHSRKVDGDQDLVAEKNKNEHVKQALTLTCDKKFQLVQDSTSMTFKDKNVTLNAGGEIVITAGHATLSIEQTGMTTFESPVGINLVCGASSLSVTPAGVVIAAPNLTATAGAGSTMVLGSETIAIKSRQVTIEADGVCKIRGKNKLKLQESDKDKAKRSGKAPPKLESEAATPAGGKARNPMDGPEVLDKPMLTIHVVDLNKKPQEGLAFQIKKPDGGTECGKLDKDGRGKVRSATPGIFTVSFPNLDGADWKGDGAKPVPPEGGRSVACRYTVQQGDRLPTIAREHGFARWQTVWDFAENTALKELRGNAHILFPKDKVAIPLKLPREAEVEGGVAEYVVQCNLDVLRVRFAGLMCDDKRTVTFKAKPDIGPELAGALRPDGTMEIALLDDTRQVLVRLFLGNAEEPFETYNLRVGHLDPIGKIEGVQSRLANLGYYSGPINGQSDEATLAAVSEFRRVVMGEDSREVDDALMAALDTAHGV